MKYDIYGNKATPDFLELPVKCGCDFMRDKNLRPIKRTYKSCQAIADRMAKKSHGKWTGIVVDCATHYRINIAGE